MHRRIKWVLFLIIAFLVLIDLLQVLWVYNTYHDQQSQYSRFLTNALGEAVSLYQYRSIRDVKKHAATFYIVSSERGVTYRVDKRDGSPQVLFDSPGLLLDSVEGGLGYSQLVQMRDRKDFNLRVFDSIFRNVLQKNDINVSYKLDTVRIPQSKSKDTTSGKGELVATLAQYPQQHEGYTEKTAQFLVNNYGDLFVSASFKPFSFYAWKQMGWMLAGILLIFAATNIALVYVILTIRRQKKISEIKNDFIANMTHELKTPVTVATSAVDAILHHHGLGNPEKVKLYMQAAKEQLLHLDQLIERILNLSIDEKTSLELRPEHMDLVPLVETVVANHRLVAPVDAIFELQTQPGSIMITADKLHLANSLNNLLGNAALYANGPVHIRVVCAIKGNTVQIVVVDNGVGIKETHHQDIFQPFFRVPQGDRHEVKGFGLGLSYVKKVVERHGGTIQVASTPGHGSTFTISLPLKNQNGA